MRKVLLILLLVVMLPAGALAQDVVYAGADNTANTKTGPAVYNYPSCYDGTNWDMVRCSAGGAADINLVYVGGTAVNVNGGVRDAGTQTVTLADDDPAVVDLAAIEVLNTTIAGDTTSIDGKITVTDADTGAGTDEIIETVCMMPGSGGASMPDVGTGNVGTGTPRWTVASDDAVLTDSTDGTDVADLLDDALYTAGAGGSRIADTLVSDNDNQIVANYFDSTSQLPPLWVADATLSQDNEPLADVVAALYEIVNDAYTAGTTSFRMEEINPLNLQHDKDKEDVTDATDGTYYVYYSMDTYRKWGVQLAIGCDAGTVTVTLEGTLWDDGTAQGSCTYEDITNDIVGVASLVATAGTATDMWIVDAEELAVFKYLRLKVVAATGANTGDYRFDSKWAY